MESGKVIISVVSYINSVPFVKSLEENKHDDFIITKDIPSECANKLINGTIDIGLIPIAMMSKVPNAKIVSDFCISGNGKVASVLLVSDSPIEEIDAIYQDSESRTSVALAKILMRDYWKKEVEWKSENEDFLSPSKHEGLVIIGDRALKNYKKFKYCYDLSEYWKLHTGLPFVFACWVANKEISDEHVRSLNNSFQKGLLKTNEYAQSVKIESDISAEEYLTHYIKYDLTIEAKKGMKLFLELIQSL